MMTRRSSRARVVLAFLAVVAALAGGVWRYGYLQGLEQLRGRGQADLALASDRLVGQLQRYRDLAVLMADHPKVLTLLQGEQAVEVGALLQGVADKLAALDVLVIDPKGHVLASTQAVQPTDLRQAAYVKRALGGALGWGHGPALPLTKRAYFHAAPVFDATDGVIGAVVVAADLNGIDYNWRGNTSATLFTDPQGTVFITNRSEVLFWRRPEGEAGLIPPKGPARPFEARLVGGHEVWELDWGPYLPARALHLTQQLPVIGMTGEVLMDINQTRALAAAQAAAVAALCLAFGSLLFLAAERRRTLAQANAALEVRVSERTAALRDTNTQLIQEARVREEAQTALALAQADLVQAGKLSALGQMSAGISHELNQPLMAIRSFAENAVQFMERDKPERASQNLTHISEMAQRMGRIIQNLRAFARQESMPQGRVDVGVAMASALSLTKAQLEQHGVTLDYAAPSAPVWVRGGEVRLGQVFVNMITNAADAMMGQPTRALRIEIEQGAQIAVHFRDTGPGIEVPDKVFDPFYTTKSDETTGGMGLGLSISYGIVQSFGGVLKGSNAPEGGAHFVVLLEPEGASTAQSKTKEQAA